MRQDIEVPGDQGDKDRGSSKDVVKINNEIDNTDGIDNTHGKLPLA